jgi:putative membrane protein
VTDLPPGPDPAGGEPDYRFSLANERTFLAWIRTSLALLAAGVGVIGVASHFSTREGRAALGLALVVLGGMSASTAYRRWRAADVAIRRGDPLPRSPMIAVVGVGVAFVAVLGIVLAIVAVA